ncbi:EAL domain-containing protein (putative c-di-GMP-specific phosphodiesterase class I)/GGDEF domain-containing protein [Actinoplanes lutulentus]|uniref:Diguanylate cyclase (GGDEF)-like protein n=1 Tax=Actinoplanes lutulentus TaxID=1287878 RepID=A0A327Z050_9ACTN|nr:bifunctional diguanylate cyclase/phosphodiesterase [Actinoplanes lutulentus]MBB2947552.1 EAL domain-containing protein (putative c-di-GMP-specific phosphodiesterase class I)/GGDEF domain-containing protein [Actinoplanes lutulentus]RAK25708.1 diguanylate cyclase (GGDEF)-like protein [Actinoplanes lutulentus]
MVAWFLPIAVVMAVAETLLIVLGIRAGFPNLLVWVPAVVGPAMAAAAFLHAAKATEGALHTFWRRVGVAMSFVLVASVSQTVDVATIPFDGMPPIGSRTLSLYVIGTILAISALLRLPGGGRSWRQLTTAVLDVAVVAVTAGIAASQYVGWFMDRFGVSTSAWWLNIAMMAIAVAGVVVVVKIMAARESPVPRSALWWLAPIGLAGPLSTVLMTLLKQWPHLNGSAAVLPFVGLFGAMAAHFGLKKPPQQRRKPLAIYRRSTAVPLVATGLTSVLVAIVVLRTGHLSTVQVAGTALLLLLVVARQAMALSENSTLLDSVAHHAMHDELTGLYSRRYFTAAAAAVTEPHTVVLIDLKDFRSINDGLGPEVGDALLIAFGQRLESMAGERAGADAIVARLGGDEFGVLLPGYPEFLIGDGSFEAAGHEVVVDLSIGIADGTDDLFRRAELALREATLNPGQQLVRYDASLERRLTQRATIAADLRRALTAGDFHLLYQPIVELPDGRMTGVESLIRWSRPDGTIVSPADFIPVAEDTGLIVELGAWIIDEVCAQAAAWRRRHGPDALRSIAVNVSARQLLDPGLMDVVASALARHGVPAAQLTVEITETAVFGGGRALATVTALSQLGVSIALDDFGTGHSSLGLLRTCPVDIIKVDKSFVDGLNGTPQQEAIAIALTGIADSMGLRTVAEGVETVEQAQRLFELGYRFVQGFHFARPLPPAGIDAMLEQAHKLAA